MAKHFLVTHTEKYVYGCAGIYSPKTAQPAYKLAKASLYAKKI